MKSLCVAVGLLAALACSGLFAQSAVLRADIPFEFQIGNTLLPAGEYAIDYSPGLVKVRGANGGHAAVALVTPVVHANIPGTGLLEFNRYGDSYFLAEVRVPYSPDGGALPKGRKEKEVASRVGPMQAVAVNFSSR